MTRAFAAVLLLAAAAHAAPSHEAASAGASRAFLTAGLSAGAAMPRFAASPRVPAAALPGAGSDPLHLMLINQVGVINTAKTPIKEIALAGLRNKQQKTSLSFTMGGKAAWISGAFDRSGEKAYVSLLEEGQPARFFNVKGLLDSPKQVAVGSAQYRLTIKADIFNQLDSEIVFQNEANRRDKVSVTLADMLDAVKAAGDSFAAGADKYAVFYYDDVSGDGAVDVAKQVFAFLFTDAKGELSVYMVPGELVTSQVSIFKMHDNRAIGLQRAGDTLKIYDQP